MKQYPGGYGDGGPGRVDVEPEERLLHSVIALALRDANGSNAALRADALAYLTGATFAADVGLLGIDREPGELLRLLGVDTAL